MNKELKALNEIFKGMQNVGGYTKEFKIVRSGLIELDDLRESNKK